MKKVCRGEYYFTATSEESEVNGFFFNNVRPAPALLFFCKSSPSDISHEYHFHAETLKWPQCVQIVFRLLYYDDYRSSNTSVYHVLLSYGLQKQFLLDPLLLAMQKKSLQTIKMFGQNCNQTVVCN